MGVAVKYRMGHANRNVDSGMRGVMPPPSLQGTRDGLPKTAMSA